MSKKILLTILLIAILLPKAVLAQEEGKISPSITIAPSILDLDVEQSEAIEEVIKVTNNSDFALPVKVDVNDYTVDEEGVPDYSLDTTEWSPKGWIELDPADLILEPLASRDITINIAIPEFADPGSHFATILFKPILPPEYFAKDSAHVIPYIGAVIALNVEGEELKAKEDYLEIREFLRGEASEGEMKEEFYSKLYNDDVYYHKVSGDIVVKNIFNREVAYKSIDGVTLFPQKVRALTSFLDQELPFGRYRAELQISDENEEVIRNIVFWERPTVGEVILLILRIILLIVLISLVVLVILKRKNLKKAFVVLLSNKK